jgi:hypothetical protein
MAFLQGLCYLLLVVTFTYGQNVIVDVPVLGKIQGIQGVTSRDQNPYWTFHGIRNY